MPGGERMGSRGKIRITLCCNPTQQHLPAPRRSGSQSGSYTPQKTLSLIQVVADDPYLGRTFDPEVDLSDVVVKIQFTTANGVRWEVPTKAETSGDPVRLS